MSDLIAEYERHLTALRRSPNTIRTYVLLLRRANRELPHGLVGACREELDDFLAEFRSVQAVLLNRAVLQGFFRWAADPEDPWIDYDPTTRLARPRPPEPDPKPVPTDLLAHILGNAADPYRTWYALAAYAGLRCIEISRIIREDITERTVRVRLGKGNKARHIPTHPALWKAVAGLDPGPVAVRDGEHLNAAQVSLAGNWRLRKLAPGVTMHQLRHWFGTETYNRTLDILTVKELMGHSSVATTQVYVRVADAQRSAAVAALPDLT